MSNHLHLVNEDDKSEFDRAIVSKYFDYVASKERELYPDRSEEELSANIRRETYLSVMENNNLDKRDISEQLYSDMRPAIDFTDEGAPRNSLLSKTPMHDGDEIQELKSRFEDAKEELTSGDDDTDWKATLELQSIALCEFALEYGYSIDHSA